MKKIVSLVVLVAALTPHPASAQLQEIMVEVDGLACPFCAYTLEKDLKKIDGVDGLAINVNEGTATLSPGSGEMIDPERVFAAVKNAGFTPRDIRVSATGRLEGSGGETVLVAPDGTHLFRLAPDEVLTSVEIEGETVYEVLGLIVPPEDGNESDDPPLLALVQVPVERDGQ